MAKNNNLTDFLTDIANVIRDRTGTNELINPQDFSSKIQQFNTLYINEGVSRKEINFYDYDGTLLYSYSKEEFSALSKLPPLLYHENMKDEEWNWTFEDIINELDNFEILDVGINCTTYDGNTRLYVNIENNATPLLLEFELPWSGDSKVNIDWGDGSNNTYTYTDRCEPDSVCVVNTDVDAYHTYRYSGNYCITISIIEKESYNPLKIGDWVNNSSFSNFMGAFYKIELGEGVAFSLEAFSGMTCNSINIPKSYKGSLGYFSYIPFISIPRGIETLPSFKNSKVEILSLPNTISSTPSNCFSGCSLLQNIFLSGVTNTYEMFSACAQLKKIHLPSEYSLQYGMFKLCGLRRFIIKEGVTSLPGSLFQSSNIEYIKIPSTVTTIGTSCFDILYDLVIVDLCDANPEVFRGYEFYFHEDNALIVVKKELWDIWFNKYKSLANHPYNEYIHNLTTDVYPEQALSLTISAPTYIGSDYTGVDILVDAVVDGYKITTAEDIKNADYKRCIELRKVSTANTSAEEKNITLQYTLCGKTATINTIQVGIGIQHIDGTLYSLDDWTANSFTVDVANGVSVSIGQHSFIIAKDCITDCIWGGSGIDILTSDAVGQGEINTATIVNTIGDNDSGEYAAKAVKNYTFPNGKVGFLPSKGELEIIIDNIYRIRTACNLLGLDLFTGDIKYILSSTQESLNSAYCMQSSINFSNEITTVSKNSKCLVIPIYYI